MHNPGFTIQTKGDSLYCLLNGPWTLAGARAMEQGADQLMLAVGEARDIVFNLGAIESLDTAGAWLIDRCRVQLQSKGAQVRIEGATDAQVMLLDQVHYHPFEKTRQPREGAFYEMMADIGDGVVGAGRDVFRGISFLGEITVAFVRVFHPRRFRLTSIVYHIESFALRGLPIIMLINFLVGCIVAQQGIFQLQKFGAATFAVDLIGILVLRELAVLLTSIMVSGRSGSAITAEIGSMKMREEIDALHVMGLDPIEVLVMPRMIALVVSLPLLTFLSDMSALFGGLLLTWVYGGISPEVFLSRLQYAISFNTFFVGLIKAPFMALAIGLIAATEGLAVSGSAESLGRQVTASVVKSIFTVIVIDGLFAMFFASIRY